MIFSIKNGKKVLMADISKQSDWNQNNLNALDFIKNKPDLSLLEDGGKLSRMAIYPVIKAVSPSSGWEPIIPDLTYNCNLGNNGYSYVQFNIDDSLMFTVVRCSDQNGSGTDTNNFHYQYRFNKIGPTPASCPTIVKTLSTSGESGGQATQSFRSSFQNMTYNMPANGEAPNNIPTSSNIGTEGSAAVGNRNIYFGSSNFLQFNQDSASKGHNFEFTIAKDYQSLKSQGYIIRLFYHTDKRRFIISGNILW